MISMDSYDGLVEVVGDMLLKHDIWRFYNLEIQLFIEENSSMKLVLNPKIHYHIESTKRINRLKSITFDIDLITTQPVLNINTLYTHLNYLISVLLINLEYKFPIVFSVYGVQFFASQINWLKWYINQIFKNEDLHPSKLKENPTRNQNSEIEDNSNKKSNYNREIEDRFKKQISAMIKDSDVKISSDNKLNSIVDKSDNSLGFDLNQIFIENLFNIEKIILHEYNTINVFKEIDRSDIKRKLFLTDLNKVKEPSKIKSLLFNYKFFQ